MVLYRSPVAPDKDEAATVPTGGRGGGAGGLPGPPVQQPHHPPQRRYLPAGQGDSDTQGQYQQAPGRTEMQ